MCGLLIIVHFLQFRMDGDSQPITEQTNQRSANIDILSPVGKLQVCMSHCLSVKNEMC